MSGVEKRGCLPAFLYGIAGWFSDQITPTPPPPIKTGWQYSPGQTVDLGDDGEIIIPPSYVKQVPAGTVTVSESGIGWSGDGIKVSQDGKTIVRTKAQEELEQIPDLNTRETLRNILRSEN